MISILSVLSPSCRSVPTFLGFFPIDCDLVHLLSTFHRIGWWENWNRKALYLMVKTMVSGFDFPLNQSIEHFTYRQFSTHPLKSRFPGIHSLCIVQKWGTIIWFRKGQICKTANADINTLISAFLIFYAILLKVVGAKWQTLNDLNSSTFVTRSAVPFRVKNEPRLVCISGQLGQPVHSVITSQPPGTLPSAP